MPELLQALMFAWLALVVLAAIAWAGRPSRS